MNEFLFFYEFHTRLPVGLLALYSHYRRCHILRKKSSDTVGDDVAW